MILGEASLRERAPLKRPSLHAEVVEAVRNMILEGELEPGARVPELQLCERLGVSRTPLREALKVLAVEDLVDLSPNRGAVVRAVSARQTAELFEVLATLEVRAGELATTRATTGQIVAIRTLHERMLDDREAHDRRRYFDDNQAVHRLIVEAAGNSEMAATHRQVSRKIARARYAVTLDARAWRESAEEHGDIVAALVVRDGQALAAAIRHHAHRSCERTIAALGSPAPDGPA